MWIDSYVREQWGVHARYKFTMMSHNSSFTVVAREREREVRGPMDVVSWYDLVTCFWLRMGQLTHVSCSPHSPGFEPNHSEWFALSPFPWTNPNWKISSCAVHSSSLMLVSLSWSWNAYYSLISYHNGLTMCTKQQLDTMWLQGRF